jgi:hypothetical protein
MGDKDPSDASQDVDLCYVSLRMHAYGFASHVPQCVRGTRAASASKKIWQSSRKSARALTLKDLPSAYYRSSLSRSFVILRAPES